ncbi:MAG: hypothetical protein V1724_05310 [Chloroflexota bacterium]
MSEKYQREIEEILVNIEDLRSHRASQKRRGFLPASRATLGSLVGGRGWHLSPGRIMLGSLALLLVALLLKSSMPGLVAPMVWTGIVLFILGYALFFINPPSYEKRWRGNVIERPPRRRDHFLRWFKGR